VTLQNRVTPAGVLVATPERGTLTGNRGVLHDEAKQIVRPWQLVRWIACAIEFRGRWRPVMAPGRWTELFFLDEATALAAGHRPCAQCRYADFTRFQAAFGEAHGLARPRADEIDRVLHADRLVGRRDRRTYQARLGDLPDGAMIELDGAAWLVQPDSLQRWSFAGYGDERARTPRERVEVLTPRATVATLRAGYRVERATSVGGRPNRAKPRLSANHVIAEIRSPSSVSTNSANARAASPSGGGR
jgi:hypothetical protein